MSRQEEKLSNCFFSKKYKHGETRTVFNSFIWESGDGDGTSHKKF